LTAHINPKRLLLIIFAVSVVLRLIAAFILGNSVQTFPGTYDQVSYHNLATNILEGKGLTHNTFWWPATQAGAQTAHWSYLYTGYLALVYALFGPNPLVARIIQAVLVGILHPLIAYLLGRKVFNETVGLISAGITAIYAYFIYYSATLMTEPFYITAILASLLICIHLAEPQPESSKPGRDWKLGFLLGLSLGIAILLRQLFMIITPFFVLWVMYSRWRHKTGIPWAGMIISTVVVLAMILPFTIFNYTRYQRFVLLNTNAGFAFFWGNHPIHGTNFYAILPPGLPSYQELIPREYRQLDEPAMDQALLKEGLKFVTDEPARYLLLSVNRLKDYFVFWPSLQSSWQSNLARLGSFTLFLPFMLYGLWLVLFDRKHKYKISLTSPISLILMYMLIYTGIHLLTWTLIRYRLPVDATLILFAGLAITHLLRRFGWDSIFYRADIPAETKGLPTQ
jgi:4-amino-4-deoxy-L-arabinose transferase-like glycosyltransferase